MAWPVAVIGLYVLVSPFVFGIIGTYQTTLIVAGAIVAVLAAYRGLMPDERVPLPFLPMAVILLGLWTIVSPFLFGAGVSDVHGITMIVAGVIFVAVPAMMINKMINEQSKAQASS